MLGVGVVGSASFDGLVCSVGQMLLEDFTHHNIEMGCNLLEVCGRFLYRSPDSHVRTKNLLVCPHYTTCWYSMSTPQHLLA